MRPELGRGMHRDGKARKAVLGKMDFLPIQPTSDFPGAEPQNLCDPMTAYSPRMWQSGPFFGLFCLYIGLGETNQVLC